MRVLAVEDEEVVARRLLRMIDTILGDELTGLRHATTLDDALEMIEEEAIDLLFLDLNLHGEDGFSMLVQAAAGSFQTIIVSAQHDAALRAFEYGVTDFVAKPYNEERLRKAIARAADRDESVRQQLKYLAVRRSGEISTIPIEGVVYISGAGDYSRIHCVDGTTALHDKTLTELARLLPTDFVRVHRSYIVDRRQVQKYRSEPGSRYFAVLATGEEVPVSRTRYRELIDGLV